MLLSLSNIYNYVVSPFVEHLCLYWGLSGFITMIEETFEIERYQTKLRIRNKSDGEKKEYNQGAMISVFKNQLFVSLPTTIVFIWLYYVQGLLDPSQNYFLTDLIRLGVTLLVEEVLFYYFHRLLHTRFLYQYVHKKHHEWISPSPYSTLYAHPFEHFLSNILPVLLSPLITGLHWDWIVWWVRLANINGILAHCGLKLPFSVNERHDLHHRLRAFNYGVFGWIDKIHGTEFIE